VELTFGEVEDVVYRIIEYMKSSGWKPSYIIFDGESHHIEHIEHFMKKFKSETVLSGMTITFIRDEKD
jgi:hypothetical protein